MKKPNLSFWDIWNMSFGFLGIQFGFALQNANTSRIFETLGASVEDIPILWIAAPVTGIIVQPIVGYYSDRTWTKLGRRRPYFLVGAILSSIALVIIPNSPTLWVAAGMLWLMDASINITMEPFRAFVGDNLPDKQRTLGFAMQSFFIGVGAVVGSLLPYLFASAGVSNTAAEGIIPTSVKWSFYVGSLVFLVSVLWTVLKSKEYSPEELSQFEKEEDEVDDSVHEKRPGISISKQQQYGIASLLIGSIITFWVFKAGLPKEIYILGFGLVLTGILFLLAAVMRGRNQENAFTNIVTDVLDMPDTMKDLAWVQFFSWFALFSMWIYTTPAVTGHVFGAEDSSTKIYNDAADWVSVMFTVYNGVAAAVAFLLPLLARKTGNRITHLIALVAGGLGLISVYFVSGKVGLLISMIGVGIAWSSILSIPYAMLSGALPSDKMGYFMGIFNFFIVIPQIVAATILGFIVKEFFSNEPIYALVVGGISMIISGLLTLRVRGKKISFDE